MPGRLGAQVAYLDAHPEVALVGTDAELLTDGRVSADATRPRVTSPDLLDWLLLLSNPLVWSTAMFRAGAARALSPFQRQDYVYAEDFDLYHRIRAEDASPGWTRRSCTIASTRAASPRRTPSG